MNRSIRKIVPLLALVSLATSCALFDSGTVWQDGRYALLWIDLPNEVTLDFHQDGGGWAPLVDKRIFAVGSDHHYIVAKQHPDGDRSRTNFYLIDKTKDEFHCVQGPMNEAAFLKLKAQLGLPAFSKTLESLQ